MRIALYQPDIAGNVGTILRTAACFGIAVDVIEPCGFPFAERALRRAGMDYAAVAAVTRHGSWDAYRAARQGDGRLVLLTTAGATPLPRFAFRADDQIILGSESAGVPAHVHAAADARVVIPLNPGFRSLNVAVAAGIAVAEALRQTEGFAPC
jgi:tRNA (cytidine/uridine-2'-O-)-methyltransferase